MKICEKSFEEYMKYNKATKLPGYNKRLYVKYAIENNINLEASDLTKTNLISVDLTNANLTKVNLYESNLTRSVLKNINLTDSSLINVNFKDSVLDGVKVSVNTIINKKAYNTIPDRYKHIFDICTFVD